MVSLKSVMKCSQLIENQYLRSSGTSEIGKNLKQSTSNPHLKKYRIIKK